MGRFVLAYYHDGGTIVDSDLDDFESLAPAQYEPLTPINDLTATLQDFENAMPILGKLIPYDIIRYNDVDRRAMSGSVCRINEKNTDRTNGYDSFQNAHSIIYLGTQDVKSYKLLDGELKLVRF